jgi:hypothetical protein
MKYRVLWLLEIVLVILLLFVSLVPIQDYAMREYREYTRHPSAETLKAFQDKSREEVLLRGCVAIFLAAAGLAGAIPLFRYRSQARPMERKA